MRTDWQYTRSRRDLVLGFEDPPKIGRREVSQVIIELN